MRLAGMRWVDHWVGLPLCFFLAVLVTLARKLLPIRKRAITGQRPIAVFKFFGLGSILQATPLLRAIRQQYPDAPLVFVSFDSNEALLRMLNLCTELRIIRTRTPIVFVLDVFRQMLWFWRHRVEAVVDLEFFSKFSTLLSFVSHAPVRIGFHLNDFWRYSLVTHPIYFNYYRHITDVYRQAGSQLGVAATDTQLSRIAYDADTRGRVRRFLEDHGWKQGQRLLGINVNAGDLCLERCWPIDRFAWVIESLLHRHEDMRIVLTGAPSERTYVLSLVDRMPASVAGRIIVVAGPWSLVEFVAGLGLFDGFLTNDSGPMHIAATEGVPMVSIWGPSRPGFVAPKVDHNRVIYADYPCSPCMLMFTTFEGMWCNHVGWCMEAITSDTVLDAVEAMLAEAAAGGPRRGMSGGELESGDSHHGQEVGTE